MRPSFLRGTTSACWAVVFLFWLTYGYLGPYLYFTESIRSLAGLFASAVAMSFFFLFSFLLALISWFLYSFYIRK